MKAKDWEKEIRLITDSDKVMYIDAITILLGWDLFRREFAWRSLSVLKSLLKQ